MTALSIKLQRLVDTATSLVAGDKGLLAMDESNPTCNKRFASLGIPQTEEIRRAYRELIVTTPALGESISGAILYDETMRQQKRDGTRFVAALAGAGIIVGIKVDTGARAMAGHPGERITEGLDGLRERMAEYVRMGARFAKWRAVIALGDGIPSRGSIAANAEALARYAALCQEVLMGGDHGIERCAEMVLPGLSCLVRAGGQPAALATARLNAMNVRFKARAPWAIAFSFARAIQEAAYDAALETP